MVLNCCCCRLAFRPRQHKLKCTVCGDLHHRTCHPKIRPQDIKDKSSSWECPSCTCKSKSTDLSTYSSLFPFHNEDLDADEENISIQSKSTLLNNILPISQPAFKKGLLFGQLNINSLVGKIDELREFLLVNKFSICGITETKLSSSYDSQLFAIKGYNILRFDRK